MYCRLHRISKSTFFRCTKKGLFRAAALNSVCPEGAFQLVF